jgi:hypothetical protein
MTHAVPACHGLTCPGHDGELMPIKAQYYLDAASGSIPLFLIVSEACAEARNAISRFELSMSPEPATTPAENV